VLISCRCASADAAVCTLVVCSCRMSCCMLAAAAAVAAVAAAPDRARATGGARWMLLLLLLKLVWCRVAPAGCLLAFSPW
jgi:hypothetical protein